MADANLEQQLVEQERKFWDALKDRDAETAVRLTDFPCLVTGPQGLGAIDEPHFRRMLQNDSYTIERAELTDVEVRLLRDDVAVLAYKVHEELTVDGKALALDAADSSTWVRRDGEWRCAMHGEALLGDPFGRDRVSAGSAGAPA